MITPDIRDRRLPTTLVFSAACSGSCEYDNADLPLATRRKRQGVDEVSELLKDIDRRGFVLRTLREAGRPITTAECAQAFARENGLAEDDARLGQVANRFSHTLDQLAKANRVRRAGKVGDHVQFPVGYAIRRDLAG